MAKERLAVTSVPQLKGILYGGKGILMMENPGTEETHTFRFRAPKNREDSRIYVRHETEDGSTYVGMLLDSSFHLTRASEHKEDSVPVKCIRYLLRILKTGTFPPSDRMVMYQSMHCPVCGRVLTKPESIRRGIGPVCAQRIGLEV